MSVLAYILLGLLLAVLFGCRSGPAVDVPSSVTWQPFPGDPSKERARVDVRGWVIRDVATGRMALQLDPTVRALLGGGR